MNPPKSDAESTGTNRSKSAWGIWLPILFFIIYVLSPGPVLHLLYNSSLPDSLITIIYGPIIYLYETASPVRTFYDWYLPIWGVK